ncbi:MAG TPA: hypothetical protein VI636_15945 [Candidatus Angelobacter sp.]
MKIQQRITKILSTIMAAALCLTPEIVSAATQQNAQSAPAQAQQQAQPEQQQQGGTAVDPSKAPLQPVTTYPDAPTPQQDQQQTTSQPVTTITQPAPQEQQRPTEPVGAAAAEKAQTAGGAASKPAGVAIAPAKQHQTRSLLFKIGAIAAGGLAAGTVYSLTRSSPSKPPGATMTGVTQK